MVRKRNHNKIKKIKKFLTYIFTGTFALFFVMLLFLILGNVLIKGYRFITTTKYFGLKYIEIKGIKNLDENYVKDIIDLEKGINIFNINLMELKNKLIKDKWIKDVSIKRIIPNTIVISIKEKNPIYILKKMNMLYYIDDNGNIIDSVSKDIFVDLPIIESNGDDIKEIIKWLGNNNFPIAKKCVGWIDVTHNYLRFYDYEHGVFWLIDKRNYLKSVDVGRKVWLDLKKRNESNIVRSIKIINNLAWVGY